MANTEVAIYIATFFIVFINFSIGFKGLKKKESLKGFHFYLFLFFVSTELTRSFFPIFSGELAVNMQDKTLAMALPQIVWGFSAIFGTSYGLYLSSKFGEKKVLIAASVVVGASMLVTGIADNYWLMLVMRATASTAAAVVGMVALIHLSGGSIKASVIAILLSAGVGASICGNAIGGWLTGYMSYSVIFFISAVFSVLSACFLFFSFKEKDKIEKENILVEIENQKKPYAQILKRTRLQAFAFLNIVSLRFVFTGFILYLVPVLLTQQKYDLKIVGQVISVYFLISYIFVNPVARMLDRFKNYRSTAFLGSILIATGVLMFGHFYTVGLSLIFISIALIALGIALSNAIQTPIIPLLFPDECRDFGLNAILSYFKTVERVGAILGTTVTALLFMAYQELVFDIVGLTIFLFSFLLVFVCFSWRAEKTLEVATK